MYLYLERFSDECIGKPFDFPNHEKQFNHNLIFKVEFQTSPELFHVIHNYFFHIIDQGLGIEWIVCLEKLTYKQKSNVSICPQILATLRPLFP